MTMSTVALALLVAQPTPSRRFKIEQTVHVPAQTAPITVWVPLPHDDAWQTITSRDAAGGEVVKDSLGNEAARYRTGGGTLKITYQVQRRERAADVSKATGKPGA